MLALLFPGQGTQHPGMLPWLDEEAEAQPLLQALVAMLGADWRARLAEAEWASANAVAQPLLVGLELAAWHCLAPRLLAPIVVAGYSVGELAAFVAAGVLDPMEALRLARVRAECMDRAVAGLPTGLLAIGDLPLAAIEAWCARHGLALAIRLGADRAIVGGPTASLAAAADDPAVAGCKLTPIAARVASHTPWMQAAAAEFAQALSAVPFAAPRASVVCDFTGATSRRPAELQRCLAAQIASPIPWDSCMESVAERQVRCVLEVGPGTTLATLWRGAYPEIPVRSVDEFRSAAAAAEWVAKILG